MVRRRFSNSILSLPVIGRLHRQLSLFLLILATITCLTLGFTTSSSSRITSSSSTSSSSTLASASGKDLLYQDQQLAMERRANEEEILLNSNIKSRSKSNELMSPKIKPKPPKSGKGFGSSSDSDSDNDTIENRIAIEQCKILQRDGVIKISNALSNELADTLRDYILQQQIIAAETVEKAASEHDALKVSKSFYGVENSRTGRCDLQLSLLNGGYLSDNGNNNNENDGSSSNNKQHTIADTLNALLGSGGSSNGSGSSSNNNGNGGKGNKDSSTGIKVGTLRHIYENLVTRDGEFYELAAVITNPGSKRQQIHPDLPYQDKFGAPLYVVFLALQVSKN